MSTMPADHTVKSFDSELKRLIQEIAQMGGLAEAELAQAIDALARRDSEAATSVIESDRRVDAMEQEVSTLAVRILALTDDELAAKYADFVKKQHDAVQEIDAALQRKGWESLLNQ